MLRFAALVVVMVLGIFLIIAGCMLVIENKRLAIYSGTGHRFEYSDFFTSTARQNIAVIGGLLVLAGFGAFVFL